MIPSTSRAPRFRTRRKLALVAGPALVAVPPASAQATLTQVTSFGSNPGNLQMYGTAATSARRDSAGSSVTSATIMIGMVRRWAATDQKDSARQAIRESIVLPLTNPGWLRMLKYLYVNLRNRAIASADSYLTRHS